MKTLSCSNTKPTHKQNKKLISEVMSENKEAL
jgi:hypothetical protein